MFTIEEITAGLAAIPSDEITHMVTMTWHHQYKARLRAPDILNQWQGAINRWLSTFNRRDAAEAIQLIHAYRLKAEPLPEFYDNEYAELQYRSFVRGQGAVEGRRSMQELGLSMPPDLTMGDTIRF